MARDSVRKALDSRLAVYIPLVLSPLPIAWEGAGFQPFTGQAYIAQTDLIARPNIAGIGVTAPIQYLGIYFLRLFAPIGAGSGLASREADALVEHFKRGTPLTADGIDVVIPRSWKGPIQQREDRFFYPVSVEYFAYDFI